AEELGDAGVGFGEGARGSPGAVAGIAEANFRDAAEGDLVFAALAADPGSHDSSVLAMISRACCLRISSEPAAHRISRPARALMVFPGAGRAACSITTRC